MNRYPPVAIPDMKGVHVKKAGRKLELYVYQNTKYYRTQEGQARHKNICIGKVCPEDCTLFFPNDKYYSYNNLPLPDPQPRKAQSEEHTQSAKRSGSHEKNETEFACWAYGYTFVFFKTAEEIGLLAILIKVLGYRRAMDVAAAAAFLTERGSFMEDMESWQERSYLPYDACVFAPQYIRGMFACLTDEMQREIFRRWIECAKEEDTVCYAASSVSAYAKENRKEGYGYEIDHGKSKQGNRVYFLSAKKKMPLYCEKVHGDLSEDENLSYVFENASDMGLGSFHLFADSGFFNEKWFSSLRKYVNSFTVGFPLSKAKAKELIDQAETQIQSYEYALPEFHLQCLERDVKIYGVSGRALVFFDRIKAGEQYKDLQDLISGYEKELSCLDRMPSRARKYREYFTLAPHENDPGFDFAVDIQKVDKTAKYYGYFLLFTTNRKAEPAEILRHCRHCKELEANEKMFDQMNHPMKGDCDPAHTEEVNGAGEFVAFIALILRSRMYSALSDYLQKKGMSMENAIGKLANIMLGKNAHGYFLMKPVTQEQREILEKLGEYVSLLESAAWLNQQ